MTHNEKQKMRHYRSKRDVMTLLRMSEEQYSQKVFDFAYGYLYDSYGLGQEQVKYITHTNSFWQWWKNEYSIADEKFLIEISEMPELYSIPMREIEELYKVRHVEPGVDIDRKLIDQIVNESDEEPTFLSHKLPVIRYAR